MHRRIVATLAGVLCMGLAGTANAQDVFDRGLYVGFGLELFDLEVQGDDSGTGFDLQSRPLGIVGRVGYNFFNWLSVEGFGATGIHDDTNEGEIDTGLAVRNGETELKYIYGAAIKPQYSLVFQETTQVTFYLVGGYSGYEFEGFASDDSENNNVQVDFTRDDSGEYYGGGLQLDGEAASFVLQFVQYADDEDFNLEGFQISVNRYF